MPNRTDTIRRGLLASGTARLARMGAAGSPSAFSLKNEAIEVEYVFDFAPSQAVLYTSGPGPFHSRHFLLDFWRHAKDGVMFLLGKEREGKWRDPTHCKPNSYVNYVPRNRFDHNKPSPKPEPRDPDESDNREAIGRLASRRVMVEIEPGMYELPPQLAAIPLATDYYAPRTYPRAAPKKTAVRLPLLNTPLEQTIQFVAASARLSNAPSKALEGMEKTLKQFPKMHITLEGNMDGPKTLSPVLSGRGPAARAFQDAPFPMLSPDNLENYNSLGQFMDARAQTIKCYLVSKGIDPRRISCKRGRVFPEQRTRRSVTVTFSNP